MSTLFKINRPALASFLLFSVFSNTNFTEITVGVTGIQTRIVNVEGKHADHLTTTTAPKNIDSLLKQPFGLLV